MGLSKLFLDCNTRRLWRPSANQYIMQAKQYRKITSLWKSFSTIFSTYLQRNRRSTAPCSSTGSDQIALPVPALLPENASGTSHMCPRTLPRCIDENFMRSDCGRGFIDFHVTAPKMPSGNAEDISSGHPALNQLEYQDKAWMV